MNIVGQQVKRVDAYGKVTGEAKYTADLEPRDILHGSGAPTGVRPARSERAWVWPSFVIRQAYTPSPSKQLPPA